MRRFLIPVFLTLAVCHTALADKTSSIDARKTEKLFASIGKEVAVRGKVLSVGKSDADKIRFLDFTTDRQHGFVAAIFPAAYKAIGDLEKYKGQRVEVRGVLEAYKAKTQIKVTKASQLTLLPAK
jgi:DNA/RNA endonuclease YhcR with UshA esterase domain